MLEVVSNMMLLPPQMRAPKIERRQLLNAKGVIAAQQVGIQASSQELLSKLEAVPESQR